MKYILRTKIQYVRTPYILSLIYVDFRKYTIMADKEVLERILSMLPEEFQDIYDDTIPEAKEIRKKMGKKVSSVKSYSCAMPMFEDIRKLNYKGISPLQRKVLTH